MLASTTTVFAQEEKKEETPAKTTFGGYLDTYYKLDPSSKTGNSLTSFTNNTSSFELGMASIYAEHKFNKAAVFIDLGFGKRAEEFVYNNAPGNLVGVAPNSQMLIKQAYLSYEVMSGLKFTAGSWATHLGVELVNAYDNRNYSMSYAFSNGPFFNTGVKADYTYDKFNFMFGVTQPTDFRSAVEANTRQKTFIAQVGYTGESNSAFINATSGSMNPISTTNITQFDLVFNQKIVDKFSASFNGTLGIWKDDVTKDKPMWFSTVLYLKYDFNDKIGLTSRSEYFGNKDGVMVATQFLRPNIVGFDVIAQTLSLNYKVGNLVIIPELRIDSGSKKIFSDKDGMGTKLNMYALVGAAYKF